METIKEREEVKKHIKECEGEHIQRAAYSSYPNALTQIYLGRMKIRTNLEWKQ